MNTLRTSLSFALIALYAALAVTPQGVIHKLHACDGCAQHGQAEAAHEHDGHCGHHHAATNCCPQSPAKDDSPAPRHSPLEDDCQLCRILGQAAQQPAPIEVPQSFTLVTRYEVLSSGLPASPAQIIARGRAPPL